MADFGYLAESSHYSHATFDTIFSRWNTKNEKSAVKIEMKLLSGTLRNGQKHNFLELLGVL